MKSSELRIGNLVKQVVTGNTTIVDEFMFHEMYDDDTYCDSLQGVPLTNEWFTKNNWEFEDHGDHGYYTKGVGEWGIFTVDADGAGFSISSFQNTISTKLEYIHQLQNFWFAITGKELTLIP